MFGLRRLLFLFDAVSASIDQESANLLKNAMGMVSKLTILGGVLWSVWGIIVLAGALKDKNGPGLQGGIWQIVGGILIVFAGSMFNVALKSIGLT